MQGPPHLRPGELPPRRVSWLRPLELARTAWHAWLSTVATEYLDRREMLAALHRTANLRVDNIPIVDSKDGLWIDFVADIGDSWEATYAVAELMARSQLRVDGHPDPLWHADVLVLGGDLVYPTPTRDGYRRRMRSALGAALPERPSQCRPPVEEPLPPELERRYRDRFLLAIPGNHDWYDGLTNFVREFCQGGYLGGWEMLQRRSYFATKVTPAGVRPGWWIWGLDIALDTRIDPPQQEFFLSILNNKNRVLCNTLEEGDRGDTFEPGDQIILCTAKPSWIKTNRYSEDAYQNLAYFVKTIVEEKQGRVPLIIAGDQHHYCRYESGSLKRQFVIAGGGGSYILGTHHLPPTVPPLDTEPEDPLVPIPAATACRASDFPYPSRAESRQLALRAVLLALVPRNWSFCLALGVIYAGLAHVYQRAIPSLPRLPLRDVMTNPGPLDLNIWRIAAIAALVCGCAAFATLSNSSGRRLSIGAAVWGAAHATAHLALGLLVTWWAVHHPVSRPAWETPALYALVMLAGGLGGATIVGLYLTLSDRLFAWHQDHVFAALSIIDYRNFVRMHIAPDGHLTLYPIGVRHVPRKWRTRLNREEALDPYYEPVDDIAKPHLIEGPITIPPMPLPQAGLAAVGAPAADVVLQG